MTPDQQEEMLRAAYSLLLEFQLAIDEKLPEHQSAGAGAVDRWLTLYEKMDK